MKIIPYNCYLINLNLKVLVVRCNHDFWTEGDHFITLPDLEENHANLFKKYKIHYPQNNKYEDDNIVIYGFDGWDSYQQTGTKYRDMLTIHSGMGELDLFRDLQRAEREAINYILDIYNKILQIKQKFA